MTKNQAPSAAKPITIRTQHKCSFFRHMALDKSTQQLYSESLSDIKSSLRILSPKKSNTLRKNGFPGSEVLKISRLRWVNSSLPAGGGGGGVASLPTSWVENSQIREFADIASLPNISWVLKMTKFASLPTSRVCRTMSVPVLSWSAKWTVLPSKLTGFHKIN